jgi:hypothetical protein
MNKSPSLHGAGARDPSGFPVADGRQGPGGLVRSEDEAVLALQLERWPRLLRPTRLKGGSSSTSGWASRGRAALAPLTSRRCDRAGYRRGSPEFTRRDQDHRTASIRSRITSAGPTTSKRRRATPPNFPMIARQILRSPLHAAGRDGGYSGRTAATNQTHGVRDRSRQEGRADDR